MKPGWYPDPDPEVTGTLRFWDGETWTDQRAPLPPSTTGTSVWTIARGVAIGLIAVLVLGYLLADCSAERERQACLDRNLDRLDQGFGGGPFEDCG